MFFADLSIISTGIEIKEMDRMYVLRLDFGFCFFALKGRSI